MKCLSTILLLTLLAGCANMASGPEPELSASSASISDSSDARNRARVNTELASLYYERGNLGVSLEVLRTAVQSDANYAPAHGMFGLVYMELRENRLAQQSFERALAIAPNDADINHNFGWFLCQTGKEAESTGYFMRAIRNPLYATPWKSYSAAGQCALRRGDTKVAEDFFEQALKLDPDEVNSLLKLAGIHFRNAKLEEARKLLIRRNRLIEPNAEALWLALRIERGLGERVAENSFANQLRRRFPGSPEFQQLQSGKYD